jgi:CBS domain-containing protein
MKISGIMTRNVITLSLEDTIGKALNIMYNEKINQIPIIDTNGWYHGMVFAKHFLNINLTTSSKLRNFLVNTAALSAEDSVKECVRLIVTTGNRALPVLENSNLIGIISETDVILKTEFGNDTVDNAMSDVIVIRDNTSLSAGLAKMRRENVSRMPVINSNGILVGVINALDRAKVMATPTERISKDSMTSSVVPASSQIKVREIMKKMKFVKLGTKIKVLTGSFKEFEEIFVVDDQRRPIGILTPRDALEMTLPQVRQVPIHIANVPDGESRRIIEANFVKFLNRIHGKPERIKSIIIYVDKYKTRKYSMRARLISTKHVIGSKAVAYDLSSASKKLISVLDRRLKSEIGRKIKLRQKPSVRYLTSNDAKYLS